jgi:hypothetical protein
LLGFISVALTYILRMAILGMAFRVFVAFYLGLWSFSNLGGIVENIGAFWYGWHFDVSMAAFFFFVLFGLHALFDLGKKAQLRLQFFFYLTYTVMICSDAIYAKESGRHLTYEIFSLGSLGGSLGSLVEQNWLKVIFSLLVASFLTRSHQVLIPPVRGLFKTIFLFIFTLGLGICLFRGFEGIPQDPSWAYRAGGGATGANISLNGAYSILWAFFEGPKITRENVEIATSIKTEEVFEKWKAGRGIKTPLHNFDGNVVIVFLEGWPGVYVDRKENGKEILPFFNSLRKDSMSVELMLAGGHRTTEGLFATLCGLPNPLGKSIMSSELEHKDFLCFPQLLKTYSSAFFQGSDQLTSGVGPMALKTGFKESYGKREIPGIEKLPQNAWGVFDKSLYDFTLSRMDQMTEPMLIGLNTNTTHDLALPPGASPYFGDENERVYHFSTTHHADSELKYFYEQLKKRPWKKDWVLVLVSDHTSFSAQNIFEHYAIPFLMKYHAVTPGAKPPFAEGLVKGAFTQNDVGTTIADMMGLPVETFLGRSMLHPQDFSEGSAIFHLGQTAWFEGPWAVVFNIRHFGKKECYLWEQDPGLKNKQICPANVDEIYERGLSYIKESQDILFK